MDIYEFVSLTMQGEIEMQNEDTYRSEQVTSRFCSY